MLVSAPKPAGTLPLPAREAASGARWILLLACALSALRFFRLGEWGLWIDEAYTLADYHHSLDGGEIFNPLGYLAVGATVRLLGGTPDELALRLLPALVGVACVPLAYWAFRPAAGARRAALAALLLAVSAWHVYWSQNARFYTLTQAVSLLGAGLLLRGAWGGGGVARRLWLTGAGVAVSALAASFHPSGAFPLPGFVAGAWIAFTLEPRRARGLRPAALLLLGFGLVGLVAAAVFGLEMVAYHARQKPVSGAAAGVVHLLKTTGFFVTPAWIAAALFGAFHALRKRDPFGLFALGVVAVGVALPLAIATRAQMTAQYVFVLLPWIAMLACVPFAPASRQGPGRFLELGYLLLLVLPALANLGLYFTVRHGERPRWREAFQYVAEHRREGELVLGMGTAIGEYYLGRGATDLKRPVEIASLAEWFPDGPRRWTRHERRIWVVVRPQWIEGFRERDQDMLRAWLADECRLVLRLPGEMEGRDLDVLVYVRD